jgi:hypothetical protein
MSLPIVTLVRFDKRVGGLYGGIDVGTREGLDSYWIFGEGETEIVSYRYGA